MTEIHKNNILLLGSGGRESALARLINKSKKLNKLYVAPGNPGIGEFATNVDCSSFDQIADFCLSKAIDILVVGPEQPLVEGITDYFKQNKKLQHIIVVGPSKNGATLEGSKDFAKQFMYRHNIPTAKYQSFDKNTIDKAKDFLRTLKPPYVLKADGLAAGKGVMILDNLQEADCELEQMFSGKFGDASNKVVIEEFLSGIECSVFVLTDGKHYILLPEAKDYKRAQEGDKGLNTGGMGSVSPVPFCTKEFMKKVETKIIIPTINGLQEDNIDYNGFVFFGLMNVNSEPYVIEYNVRMGDPESESVLARIDSDIVEAFELMDKQLLNNYKIEINSKVATTIMLCSGGYPLHYEKNKLITGLNSLQDTIIYHAGTKQQNDKIFTNGGRVIALTTLKDSIQDGLDSLYEQIEKIHFEQMFYRKDIGKDLI